MCCGMCCNNILMYYHTDYKDSGTLMKFDVNDKDFSIWLSENISAIEGYYYKAATQNKCYLCDKLCSSFCNSHSIPQFVLENLGNNGIYSNYSDAADIDILKHFTGKKNAGTFEIICRDCDSSFFADYEKKEMYNDLSKPLSENILSQIAIKNHLYAISKANYELSHFMAIYDYIKDNKPEFLTYFNISAEIPMKSACKKLQMNENNYAYDRYYGDKNIPVYEILEQIELPYTVPIALQLAIPVHKGLSGESINVFVDGVLYMLHVCIFPLENKSLILLFAHSTDDKYKTFKTDINKLSLNENLSIINYIIFQYSEDFYCNTKILEQIKKDSHFVNLCRSNLLCDLIQHKNTNIPNILKEAVL